VSNCGRAFAPCGTRRLRAGYSTAGAYWNCLAAPYPCCASSLLADAVYSIGRALSACGGGTAPVLALPTGGTRSGGHAFAGTVMFRLYGGMLPYTRRHARHLHSTGVAPAPPRCVPLPCCCAAHTPLHRNVWAPAYGVIPRRLLRLTQICWSFPLFSFCLIIPSLSRFNTFICTSAISVSGCLLVLYFFGAISAVLLVSRWVRLAAVADDRSGRGG